MKNDQDRQGNQADPDRNSPSVPNSIESEESKPSISDRRPSVIKEQTDEASIHQGQTDNPIDHSHTAPPGGLSISDLYIIWLTAILALTSIIGAIIIGLQLKVMQDQLDEMRGGAADTRLLAESAKKQADNTERLATAAIEQLRHLETTVTLTHENIALTKQTVRAWLVIAKVERTSDFVPNSPITFSVKFKNVGPSTSANVTHGIAVWTCQGEPSLSCASQCPQNLSPDPRTGETMIGPQAESFLAISFPARSPDAINALKSGRQTAYFCGRVDYKDLFNTPRTLHHCSYYQPDLDKFGACPVGNFDT